VRPYASAALLVLVALVLWWRHGGGSRHPRASASVDRPAAIAGAVHGAAGNPGSGAVPIRLAPVAPARSDDIALRARWGSGAKELGRRRNPESNPEAPMAIAAGSGGDFAVVDQVNRRVQRYRDGKLVGTLALGGDTVQDVALGAGGRTVLLDRLADGNVQVWGPDGRLQNEITLAGAGVKEGGAVTGVFADDDGIYVERDHDTVVRVAAADGSSDPARPTLAGRPSRDGRLLLRAAIADAYTATVTVSAVDRRSGVVSFSQTIVLGAPILHILMLDSDARGYTYLAVDIGDEAPSPPYVITNERIEVVRLDGGGVPRGRLAIAAPPTSDESFRPISVDAEGVLYFMVPDESGLTVTRYRFD
jgi:hypothetical protein